MFRNILDAINQIYIPDINFFDAIEILIISVCLYYIIKSVRDTRLWVVAKGLILLGITYLAAYIFSFDAILTIFQTVAVVLTTAIVVVFQPEIRKFLESVGSKKYVLPHKNKKRYIKDKITDNSIDQIVSACKSMSKTKTGALIVLEKDIPLNEYIDTGIKLNADISSQLLLNTFEKNTPLHDGAIVLREDKIIAATCYLPLSENEKISKKLGTRHRAALGISEVTDAIVIIVSEETGSIAIAKDGKIKTRLSDTELKEELIEYQTTTAIITKPTAKDFITKNYKLKLMSVVLGIICWIALINTSNPMTIKTFNDIPITIKNESTITDIGKTYTIQTPQTVKVSVKCNRRDVEKLTNEDIVVIADFDKLSPVYSVILTGSVPSIPDAEVTVFDDNMKVNLEDLVETEYKLTVNKVGKPNDNCYVHSISPDIEAISIKGPASLMKIIDIVCIDVNVTGIQEDESFKLKPIIYDKNGAIITSNKLTLNNSLVSGTINTLKTKSVPITVNLKPSDLLTTSLIKSHTTDTTEVKIAASDDVLATIDNINLDVPITIDESQGSAEKFSKNIKLKDYYGVAGVYFVDENISTNISIEYNDNIQRKIKMPTSAIRLLNTQSKYKYRQRDESIEITLSGPRLDVLAVDVNKIEMSIDVGKYYTGSKTATVIFKEVANVQFETTYAVIIVEYK